MDEGRHPGAESRNSPHALELGGLDGWRRIRLTDLQSVSPEVVELLVEIRTRYWKPPDVDKLQEQCRVGARVAVARAELSELLASLSEVVQGIPREISADLGAIDDMLGLQLSPGVQPGKFEVRVRVQISGIAIETDLTTDIACVDRFELGLRQFLQSVDAPP